jgi:hypothetical protein
MDHRCKGGIKAIEGTEEDQVAWEAGYARVLWVRWLVAVVSTASSRWATVGMGVQVPLNEKDVLYTGCR